MSHLSATDICRLMCEHKKTIRGIATRWNVTQKRVREVRAKGVQGEHFVNDWIEILTTP